MLAAIVAKKSQTQIDEAVKDAELEFIKMDSEANELFALKFIVENKINNKSIKTSYVNCCQRSR